MIHEKKKILVLDDEPSNAKMLSAMLTLQGYENEQFLDPVLALEALLAHPQCYHLVLADRVMPKLEAPQLIEKLRQNETTKAIPVVVITGLAETFEKIELIRAGAFDILIKPLDMSLLVAVVKRALATSGESL
jgi:DNA-binding response OmpR family regulator